MSKLVTLLFPWRKTFKRLELEKKWWHRLVAVVFFLLLAVALLASWAIANDARVPVTPAGPNIYFIDSVPMGGTTSPQQEEVSKQRTMTAPGSKYVQMPDGTGVSYSGTTSDETIKADWQHREDIAQWKALIVDFFIAVLVTLAFSYLLQGSYRALLYVVYGSKAKDAPDSPVVG